MEDLIKRLEAAEAGGPALNVCVARAFGWHVPERLYAGWHDPEGNHVGLPPNFTTSLDAALALAERVLPFHTATIVKYRTNGGEFKPSSQANLLCVYGEIREHCGRAATPALALCIAILRAKMETEK